MRSPRLRQLRWFVLLASWTSAEARAQGPADVSKGDAETFLVDWAKAQRDGDFARYAAMYAPEFRGVRRTGKSKASLDRSQWLQDRERMFKAPMTVVVDYTEVKPSAGQASVTFVQHWSSGDFADVGRKRMALRRADGGLLIAEEDMLCSWLVRHNGREVLYANEEDRPAARAAYPGVEARALPEKWDDCSPRGLQLWTFAEGVRTSFSADAGTYEVVTWDEQNNPKATTNLEITEGGGIMLLRNGKRIWKKDQSGCDADAMFAVPGGVVLPMRCSVAYHGEASSDLDVYRITGDRVSQVGHVPVTANDSGSGGSYSYEANVEYRDTDGNGVPDIVVTPTLRRNVGRAYPKGVKVIKF